MIWYHAEINILGWEVHLSSYFGGNELGVGPENWGANSLRENTEYLKLNHRRYLSVNSSQHFR